MNKLYVVRVRDWGEEGNMMDYSYRTQAGADVALEQAKKMYCTANAHVDEVEVKE